MSLLPPATPLCAPGADFPGRLIMSPPHSQHHLRFPRSQSLPEASAGVSTRVAKADLVSRALTLKYATHCNKDNKIHFLRSVF